MAYDDHKNFAYTTLSAAPVSAASGVSLPVVSADAALFPTPPFNATVWALGEAVSAAGAEIVRVTGNAAGVFTVIRAQEGSTARQILATDQIAATITDKVLTDIEDAQSALSAAHISLASTVSAISDRLSVETVARTTSDAALSARIDTQSAAISVLSQQASVNSVDHVSLAQAISVVSNALSAEIVNRTSADTVLSALVSTLSNAVTSVNARATSIAAVLSNVSATSLAGGSATGLQAVIDALSNKISGVVAGTASVTSNELSTVANRVSLLSAVVSVMSTNVTSLQSTVSHLASIVSNVSAQSAGGSASGLQAVIDMLSNKISQAGGGTGSVTSAEHISTDQRVSLLSAAVSLEISARLSTDNRVSVLSAAVSVMSTDVTSLHSTVSHIASIVSLVSAVSAAGTAVGLQSVVNALSQRISLVSNAASAADSHASVASLAATSADGHANTVSAAAAAAETHAAAASAAATSIGGLLATLSTAYTSLASTVSHLASIVSGVSATSAGGGSATGLQAVVDALSNKISATAAGTQSITSAEYLSLQSTVSHLASIVSNVSAQSAGGSATGLQNVIDMLSNKISQAGGGAGSVTSTELSVVRGQVNYVSVAQAIPLSATTDISGTTVPVSADGLYRMHGQLFFDRSGVSVSPRFGLAYPGMKNARGTIEVYNSANAAGVGNIYGATARGWHLWKSADSGTFLVSTVAAATDGQVIYNGMFLVCTTGNVVLQAAAGAGGTLTIREGSFIQMWKLN